MAAHVCIARPPCTLYAIIKRGTTAARVPTVFPLRKRIIVMLIIRRRPLMDSVTEFELSTEISEWQ